ncbi:MAG: NAD+ synthase [Candidatus Krumholzibacteriia bacterium]
MNDKAEFGAADAWIVPPEQAAATAAAFVADTVATVGASGVVVGLSGGIDSAVAAAIAVRGLGAARVQGLLLPYATSAPTSLSDARAVADCLGVATDLCDITAVVDALLQLLPETNRVRRGNVMARVRMIALYDLSAREQALVLGTGNRSEILLGYTTLYGDAACGLNPIGNLYKTEIRALAAHLGLPEAVIQKPPSADLWVGQADEEELGFTYAEVDRLLHHLVDEELGDRQLAALGFAPVLVTQVRTRVRKMAFKRRQPPMADFPGRLMPADG